MNTVYTIGHSTRAIEEFVDLLRQHSIAQLVDIRTIPRSRHNPQFAQEALDQSLSEQGISYIYLSSLGGLRPSVETSENRGWRNKSFRNYADYMQTEEFSNGLVRLIDLSKRATTAIMCAEAVPWRCHRSLVADALTVRSVPVCEIIGPKSVWPHKLTAFARVVGDKVTYPEDGSRGGKV
ncbi:DNA repair protein [Candidatus Saccharibacteria bacterium 32-49-12]|nr:MAG: DNA repair protein [Candidatus Saccharibacteria bacterium 32-49-12]